MTSLPNALAELTTLHQWVVWRWEVIVGRTKPTKVPFGVAGRRASTVNPLTWLGYQEAAEAVDSGEYEGLGFVFSAKDPYCGIDLDRALAEDTIAAWADAIVRRFDSYTEISPSKSGLHILVRGVLPQQAGNRTQNIELYDRGRYFAITGNVWSGEAIAERQAVLSAFHQECFPAFSVVTAIVPTSVVDRSDAEVLDRARNAANGHAFCSLFDGTALDGYADRDGVVDRSRADFALATRLAWWSSDPEQVERLMRSSALVRPKWDSQRGASTYLRWSVERAMQRVARDKASNGFPLLV